MTKNEQTLYTFIIRILYKHSKYSRSYKDTDPQNKFLTAEEILTHLNEDAKKEPALNACFKQYPNLSPSDLDQFLSTVKNLEYPKEINPTYFSCKDENSEGKTIHVSDAFGLTVRYAIPKKKAVSAPKNFESNDFLVLIGMVLTKTENGSFKISDLEKSIRKLAGEHTPGRQSITKIAKKLCRDENVKRLGFCIEYDTEEGTRTNKELTFSIYKIFDPFEASMLADMLKTYPYYSAEFANRLIEKLQFFDENGVYTFSTDKKNALYQPTPNIPTLIDTSIRGSFRLEEKECDQFLHHIEQLKHILRLKCKAIMTYGQRVLDPDKERGQILTVRERTVIHPHELVWANGYYYFVATPETEEGICEKHAHNYRVDRIIKLEELEEEKAKPIYDEQKDFSNGQGANFSPVAYRGTHNMMMRGDIYNIKLKCKKPLLSHVLDCFGTNTKIKKLHGKDEDWFEASFRSTLGGVAYGVTQYMDECIVLEPEELRNMVFKNLATGLANYADAGLLPDDLKAYYS